MKRLYKGMLLLHLTLLAGCQGGSPGTTPSPAQSATATPGGGKENKPSGFVNLDEEQRKKAGILLRKVENRALSGGLSLTGSLAEDADRKALITSSVGGKIIDLRAGVGNRVTQGQILATIDSTELSRLKADYHESETAARLASQSYLRRSSLSRYSDEVREPLEQSRKDLAGVQAELKVAQANQDVAYRKFQRVKDLSGDGITSQAQVEQALAEQRGAQAKLEQARAQLKIAQGHQAREQRVASLHLLSGKETQEAQADVEKTATRRQHLRENLLALKADPDAQSGTATISAPISGIVLTRPVTLGQVVNPAEALFSIVDISRLWLWVDIPENRLKNIREGLTVRLTVPTYPGESFQGRVSFVSPELDETSRSAKVRVLIPNPTGRLKPHMSATVEIQTGVQKTKPAVPQEAIQTVEGQSVVYLAAGDRLERRAVQLGVSQGGWTEVLHGLRGDETVVAQGSFVVKSQDLKDQIAGDKD
jgi:RND family efflux transporter MFP subunit